MLRQLGYSATEARKAVDLVWEKYGPSDTPGQLKQYQAAWEKDGAMQTAAEVVRKVFEKRPPRPEADGTSG